MFIKFIEIHRIRDTGSFSLFKSEELGNLNELFCALTVLLRKLIFLVCPLFRLKCIL
jgi:hypothetical protein